MTVQDKLTGTGLKEIPTIEGGGIPSVLALEILAGVSS